MPAVVEGEESFRFWLTLEFSLEIIKGEMGVEERGRIGGDRRVEGWQHKHYGDFGRQMSDNIIYSSQQGRNK